MGGWSRNRTLNPADLEVTTKDKASLHGTEAVC